MSTAPAAASSSEFVDFWNDILVPKFVKYRHILVGGLTHHSERVFPRLEVREGDKVVDVGCGFGDTAILLAKRVGPSGSVLGIDCCEAFLEFARADAAAAGVTNVTFVEGDVQGYPFDSTYDFCFARFGTQFFENPVAGLRSMRNSLRPGGIMTMIVWRTIDDNPWLGMPREIILRHLPPPGEDARTCGPGPFSMADEQMVTKQLEIAGYDEIEFERIDAPLMVGNTVEDAIGFQLALGPAGEVYREAGAEAESKHDEIVAALANELAKYVTDEGVVMQSSSWKVRARNPA
ncbi:MAG: methyltransferase domain-containing protein [Gammaproteobacteria bacterium]|nr:methyltransferase domain-containing protein [Gammaproteobacteria bacterium]NIM74566.1 methyltransferase domain-containing protein [Gammaproteobacteria bacterium]NIO26399.1 methyltransferase domain-containing protein [Gammaproteobacteria bacterium]NIO66951.1 methyltransferase domain-containing protein [Gammaproteobacteria bacterium]NIP44960.1 methyltransferase domain-containing protein [Gammaproteobacteria bacterium]